MNWYSIRITKTDALQGKTEKLISEITDLFRQIDNDPSIAVFTASLQEETVDFFFSPAAADRAGKIIHLYWGCPSEAPPPTSRLLFGSIEALEIKP